MYSMTSTNTPETELFLKDSWRLWFHDPNGNQWDKGSYQEIGRASTVKEFAEVQASMKGLWEKGMFFWMRDHIMPMWEDENNEKGGCFSYKINVPDVPPYWFEACTHLVLEKFMKNEEMAENICGLSIAPKRGYSIVRVWIKESEKQDPVMYEFPTPSYTSIMFKPFL